MRGADKLWTERLLGTSLEGLYYGHRLTGDAKFLAAFREMFDTAYRHVTGDAAALATINPGVEPSRRRTASSTRAEQHDEGRRRSTVVLRLDERAADRSAARIPGADRRRRASTRSSSGSPRFLRDVGSHTSRPILLDDTFLKPTVCDDPTRPTTGGGLVPLYGAGLDRRWHARNFGQLRRLRALRGRDRAHAAAIRALKRQGKYDKGGPIGPFASEGESFLQLHHEFASCAQRVFQGWIRTGRDPATWTSASLASGFPTRRNSSPTTRSAIRSTRCHPSVS